MIFEQVMANEEDKINYIYEIIKKNGKEMLEQQGLIHWKTPYPKESIKEDCEKKNVFLVKDGEVYVHTFQLEITSDLSDTTVHKKVTINKFATSPEFSGRGIGKKSIRYIGEFCNKHGISKISLDVYDKSSVAINFYKKVGFTKVGSKRTKHFTVHIMEKNL